MAVVGIATAKVGFYAYASKGGTEMHHHYIFDVSYLRDPIGHKEFKGLDGRYAEVQKWIADDKRVKSILDEVKRIIIDQIDINQGAWLSVAFVDPHGKWIAAAMVEMCKEMFQEKYPIAVVHEWVKV